MLTSRHRQSPPHRYRLRIGQVVMLKSDDGDHPPMTVVSLAGLTKGHVTAQWRDKMGRPQAAQYHEDALTLVAASQARS